MAEKVPLLQSQKSAVFRWIEKAGFLHHDFAWDKVPSEYHRDRLEVERIRHVPSSGYFFQFDCRYRDGVRVPVSIFSPAEDAHSQTIEEDFGWMVQEHHVRAWLGYLAREISEPDLWAAVSETLPSAPTIPRGEPNTPFSPDEQSFISKRLERLETELVLVVTKSVGVTATLQEEHRREVTEQIRDLTQRLDYHAKRLGRRDWSGMAIGLAFQHAAELALSAEVTKNFLKSVWGFLRELFSGGGGLIGC